mgnify:CR=1 FL=1
MAETIDDITINFESDGKLVIKELNKAVLTKGSWTTIMFLYQDLDKKNDTYNPAKVAIRRYQKRGGGYRLQSKFTISNKKQGEKIIEILNGWYGNMAVNDSPEGEDNGADA